MMPENNDIYQFFAVCPPDIMPFLDMEMRMLGLPVTELADSEGGIGFTGGMKELYSANLHLRTSTRVLVRFAGFLAAGLPEFRRKISNLQWEKYLKPDINDSCLISTRVTCRRSRLYHSGAVEERLLQGISDRLNCRTSVPDSNDCMTREDDCGPPLVVVRIVKDICTISIDSSGAALHKRGYRLRNAKAPMRETLAAAVIMASGWDLQSPLLDPFCGSGTIPIEAGLMACGIPPGINRHFAFMDWPGFEAGLWDRILDDANRHKKEANTMIAGSDRDSGAITAATENSERAGLNGIISFKRQSVSETVAPEQSKPGWLITNPPYGKRIGPSGDIRSLYQRFGAVIRSGFQTWNSAILCPGYDLYGQTGLKETGTHHFNNGGIRVTLHISNP